MALGVAVIGAGGIAGTHVEALKEIGEAKLCGVWSHSPAKLQTFADRYGIPAYQSLEELLQDHAVQVVVLCLPPGLNTEYGLQAAEAGKHLIVEKPIDTDAVRGERLIKTYRDKGLTLSVIFQNRFTPAMKKAKQAIAEGLLGKIYLADGYAKLYRSAAYYDSGAWRGTKALEGGGAFINQGIHTIDMLQWLMGGVKSVEGVVKTVRHNIEVEDMGTVLVEYNNGAIGVLEISTAIEPGYMERMEIHGEKGTIVMDKGNILEWKVQGCKEEDYLEKRHTATGAANSPAVSYINHKEQLAEILASIMKGKDPLVTGEEGIKALKIVQAIYESSAKRQRVYVSLMGSHQQNADFVR